MGYAHNFKKISLLNQCLEIFKLRGFNNVITQNKKKIYILNESSFKAAIVEYFDEMKTNMKSYQKYPMDLEFLNDLIRDYVDHKYGDDENLKREKTNYFKFTLVVFF